MQTQDTGRTPFVAPQNRDDKGAPKSGFRPGRIVEVAFTPMAADRPFTATTLFGPSLRTLMAEILRGVFREPSDVIASRLEGGAVCISPRAEPWLCIAIVRNGPEPEFLNTGFGRLAVEGWRL